MDPRLLVVLLILGAVSVWSSKNTGNQGPSKNKKNTTRLSAGIANNPFLQRPITLPSVGGNLFLQFYGNNSKNQLGIIPSISPPTENQSSYVAIFSSGNPFLNTKSGSQIDIVPFNASGPFAPAPFTPVTQVPYRPPFHYTPTPPRPEPPTPQRPFFEEVRPLTTSSLLDLIPIKIGSTQSRSEFKCEEYVREIVGTTNVALSVGMSVDVIKMENTCRNVNILVVGGNETAVGEFPHMAALGRLGSDGFALMCGGSLISHTWILSAAHCTYGPDGGPSDARIGIHSLMDQQSGITIAIENMVRHPEFSPPAMYADIALIKLRKAVTFSELVRPACLYQQYDGAPTAAWVSGWGATELTGRQVDKLRKALLNFVDNLSCTIQLNDSREVPYGVRPSMICAGDPHGGWNKDSCQGDSGGPLQVIHPKNQCLFQVIGITSFGQGCALVNSPGVYTRVSHYLPWIENIVWPQGQ